MINLGLNPLYYPSEVYFIGDIHSEGNKLELLLNKILPLNSTSHIVFLGDLLDWGNESLKTLKIIFDLKNKYPNQIFCIEGNHEQMIKEYLLDKVPFSRRYESWSKHGGFKVIKEFMDNFNQSDPIFMLSKLKELNYWSIYENLIPYYETEKLLATHSPLEATSLSIHGKFNKNINLEESCYGILEKLNENIRWTFSSVQRLPFDFKKQLICGHQHVHKKPMIFKDRVFLDCGAGYKDVPLFAVKFPGKTIISSS